MTTIAANRDMMAGDSSADHGGVRTTARKIFRMRGNIVGIAGNYSHAWAFIEWARNGGVGHAPSGDYDALVLQSDGKLVMYDSGKPSPVYEAQYAIGSGAAAARAAMYMGADPTKAVRIAAKVDTYTKGRVVAYKRVTKRRRKK